MHRCLLALLIGTTIAACTTPEPGTPAGSGNPVADPRPVPPRWLTAAESERLSRLDPEAAKAARAALDAFVALCGDEAPPGRVTCIVRQVAAAKWHLRRLLFDVSLDRLTHPAEDPDFARALSAFERGAGLGVDGVFTLREFERLAYLSGLADETRITPMYKSLSAGRGGGVMVQGVWVLKGERIAWPLNSVRITCWRDEGTCREENATLVGAMTEREAPGDYTLSPDQMEYRIVSWTTAELQARAETACRQTILTINWVTKVAFTTNSDITRAGCPGVGPLTSPRIATVEDGIAIAAQYYAQRHALLKDLPYGQVRAKVQQLFSAQAP